MAAGPIKSLINWHLSHTRDYIDYAKMIKIPDEELGSISQCYIRFAENHLKAAERLVKEMENA